MKRRVVVIGGGITGLAAAWEASSRGDDVTVLEAGRRWGGLIRTSPIDIPGAAALDIDEGADAFLARVPEGIELCEELGLRDRLTQPASGRAQVWARGALHWLPQPAVLGVPLDLDALDATGLLDRDGLAAVAAEPTDSPPLTDDVAIGPFLRGRFGDQLVDRVVAPLVGGINAGDIDEMSLRAVVPQLASAAERGGSLTAELHRRAGAAAAGPVFHALLGGTAELVDSLAGQLAAAAVDLRLSTRVTSITVGDGRAQVWADDTAIEADRVVLATPARVSAQILAGTSRSAVELLGGIDTASVVLTTLVWPRADVPAAHDGHIDTSGFVVARDAGLLMTAASYGSAKWTHWDDGEHVVVRASSGHRRDERPMSLTDEELVGALAADLRTTTGISAAPVAQRVSRWDNGFHQYTVGHLDRVDEIDAALAAATNDIVRVAGSAYRGVGIPACIRQGRAAVA